MSGRNEQRKAEIYSFINGYLRENGVSPTTEEICRQFGISKSTASKFVNRLAEEGLLGRVGRYGLVSADAPRPRARMPIVGSVACGRPTLADEDIMGYITVDEDILGSSGEYFALVAEGDSMIDADIRSGDIVYVERADTAEDGNIVVAMIIDEETGEPKATLKRFFRDEEGSRYILRPENSAYSDIIVDSVKILGIARHILKRISR